MIMLRTDQRTCGMWLLVGLSFMGVAAGCAAAADDSVPTDQQRAFIETHPARQLYIENCGGCHGRWMQGGSASSFLDDNWTHGSEPEQILKTVTGGHEMQGMPAFAPTFTEEEQKALVDLLRYAHAGKSKLNPSPRTAAPRESAEPAKQIENLRTRDYNVKVEVVVDSGLKIPWAIDFLNPQTALVTEKPGRLRWLINGRLDPQPIEGIPPVRDSGQGGLMDVAFDPEYGDGTNDWVYLAYTEGRRGNRIGMTKIVRGRIDGHRWTDQQVLFEARDEDYVSGGVHFGCRTVFDKDGYLFFAIGERGRRDHAQRLDKPNGKIHRINRDGSIPESNPFVNAKREGEGPVYPSIYSYGHRNPQGLAIHPQTDALWITEHGPRGGDELNLVEPGKNYGWPIITYGINYNGTLITEEFERDGLEQPVLYWVPSIAACGLDVYRDGPFKRWQGNLFAGGLAMETVRRLVIHEGRVIHDEEIVKGLGRVRDVCCGPDGCLYIVHNTPDRILRLSNLGRSVKP
jgi:glucose/arabinose dehydrogenase